MGAWISIVNKFLLIMLCLIFHTSFGWADVSTSKNVNVQLRWFHQFQFAGYYAAIEKGFYKDEGLNVRLTERDLKKTSVNAVLSGEAQYGVADAGLLVQRMQGDPVVLLMQIYQHSPIIIITKQETGINNPYALRGKRLMFDEKGSSHAVIVSTLTDTLGGLSEVTTVKHTFRLDEFIAGEVDAISGYITSQPFILENMGIKTNIINPRDYGIDFYGDNLFTTELEVKKNPDRVKKMISATLKGWEYALNNPDEIIKLIKEGKKKLIEKEFVSMTSMNTWVYEEDIGRICSFLISNDAPRISGQVIAVDGNTLRMH